MKKKTYFLRIKENLFKTSLYLYLNEIFILIFII
jgi:hypothetical protein